MSIIVEVFPSGPLATNAYVVACDATRVAAVVDPAPGCANAVTDYVATHQLTVEKILLTHSHWDHIGDAAKLKGRFGATIYLHGDDLGNLKSPGSDGIPMWTSIEGSEVDEFIDDGDVVEVGNLHFKVIHTPGHSPGGVCYYCEGEQVLFSGDTLFKGSIGNLALPTANAALMWQSLAKLAALPADTRVFSGHGEATTLQAESWLPRAKEIFG